VRTIAVMNLKGGSGRTAVSVCLAHALAELFGSTLLVDADPQAHATAAMSIDPDRLDAHLGHALIAPELSAEHAEQLIWPCGRTLSLLPSAFAMSRLETADSPLAVRTDRDTRLAAVLGALGGDRAFAVIDTPPSLGVLSFNAAIAAGVVVIVADASAPFAMQSTTRQVAAVRAIAAHAGVTVALRLLINRDADRGLAALNREQLAKRFADLLPRSPAGEVITVPASDRVGEALALGVPLSEHAPGSPPAVAIERLAVSLAELAPAVRGGSTVARGPASSQPGTTIDEAKPAAFSLVRQEAPAGLFEQSVEDAQSETDAAPAHTEGPRTNDARAQPRRGTLAEAKVADRSKDAPPTRAAELAARTRLLSGRLRASSERLAQTPGVAEKLASQSASGPLANGHEAALSPADRLPMRRGVRSLLGARSTSAGVLFVAEADPGATVSVQGDFQGWSQAGTPMRYNPSAGAHELLVRLGAGVYRYRVLIDGKPTLLGEPQHRVDAPGIGKVDSIEHRPRLMSVAAR
jgi:chromosome partitioning protein